MEAEGAEIALSLQKALIGKGKTLAFAESCTGGFLSHLMTSNAGSSQCFLGSIVTYSNRLKSKVLGVKEETLALFGAVSKETVEEMLVGIFRATDADFAIAVSGVAGPDGGTETTPVGLVHYALGEKGKKIETGFFQLVGDRKKIISIASCRLLALLCEKVHF